MRLNPASRSSESGFLISSSVSIQRCLWSTDHFDRNISIVAWTHASAGLIVPIKSITLMTRSRSCIKLNGVWDAFEGERLFEALCSTSDLRKWHSESNCESSVATVEKCLGGKVEDKLTESLWKRVEWTTDIYSNSIFASTSASRRCRFTLYCEDAWVRPWSSPIMASMPACMMWHSPSRISAPNTSEIMASKVTFLVKSYKSTWLPSKSGDEQTSRWTALLTWQHMLWIEIRPIARTMSQCALVHSGPEIDTKEKAFRIVTVSVKVPLRWKLGCFNRWVAISWFPMDITLDFQWYLMTSP